MTVQVKTQPAWISFSAARVQIFVAQTLICHVGFIFLLPRIIGGCPEGPVVCIETLTGCLLVALGSGADLDALTGRLLAAQGLDVSSRGSAKEALTLPGLSEGGPAREGEDGKPSEVRKGWPKLVNGFLKVTWASS